MNLEFDIKLQEKDLFRFNMYHSYHKAGTWVFTFIGLAILVISFTTMDEITANYTMLYWACSLLLIFYTPINLKTTAKLRMRQNNSLSKTLHYVFSDEGIRVSFAETENEEDAERAADTVVAWNELYRLIETKTQILIYTSRINASVLPKAQIEDMNTLRELFKKNLEPHRLTLKK